MNRQIGRVTKKIIKILGLNYDEEKTIFIGDANIKHMKEEHPKDFEKYGSKIEDIIKNPTYNIIISINFHLKKIKMYDIIIITYNK